MDGAVQIFSLLVPPTGWSSVTSISAPVGGGQSLEVYGILSFSFHTLCGGTAYWGLLAD